ncbi:MAG: sugar ABC transporter substrate-binding protein [Armatimonadetes bacterium]|nr:sugar ABC transporter substrate-binding protein [Armatimonadota bacterium]MDE2205674.1 sugar ABC transporter substrate-binding protein [Armatimonadota bacterium]
MSGRHIHRSERAALLGVVISAILLSGCHGGGAASTGSGANSRLVAIISPAKTSEFHVELPKGAAAEAQKLGWPPIIDQAPQKESDYAGQVALAQDIIQKQPAAISVCGINPDALNTIIQKANAAGVPIFVHNQITPVKGNVVSYIGYDELKGGEMCGAEAASLLKQKNGAYKGEVAILDGEPGDHTDARAGGFKQALAKYPGIKVVAEQNGQWLRAPGTSITRDWLQRFPGLDLVFGCSDAMAQGAAQAARDSGRTLLTVGIDGNSDSLKDISQGKMTATLATQPRKMGQAIIDTMNLYFQEKKAPKVVETPCVIVTKANVGQFLQPSSP